LGYTDLIHPVYKRITILFTLYSSGAPEKTGSDALITAVSPARSSAATPKNLWNSELR
jgi:hypothetical protein